MAYKIKITGCDILPPERDLVEAAAYGITTLIIKHLREKNDSTSGNRYGLPKTNYYATEWCESGERVDVRFEPNSGNSHKQNEERAKLWQRA